MKKVFFSLVFLNVFLSIAQKEIKFSEYGFYHNEVIRLYNEKFLKGDIEKISNITVEEMTKVMLELMKGKYPEEFKNITTEQLKNYFDSSTTVSNYDFYLKWKLNKNDYLKKGYLSQKIINLIDDIAINGKDYKSINNIIISFKSKNNLTEKELNNLIVFESVLKESNNLWSQGTTLRGGKNPCTPRTIVSDAGATLCTWYFGPLSVIAGAASSLITYYSDSNC
ncbi:hypothetical protein M0M57_05880 [Flavobacterium azooxidireducens]|uniref:Uncharacterized protein n=1 Tax=Flavobacterium azooxidireducens TaxID=1871076 RepID=A0ABY4KLS3_9FLAO|nr:hypothetical protein [Flavobacterium azooxidireducens]UPQ80365.1 hypothetical protein M0M57_05880 [Flavobacterium azooxidireducens]